MIKWRWLTFGELSTTELYELLQLRAEVFIVEQDCVYQDLDGKDQEALHLLGYQNEKLVAYIRLFSPQNENDPVVFGRVLSSPAVRGEGIGKKLIEEVNAFIEESYPTSIIKISAQDYLRKFYQSFGYEARGDIYDEDGIPHIAMYKTIT